MHLAARKSGIVMFIVLIAMSRLLCAQGSAVFQTPQTWSFSTDGVSFSNEFSGARLNGVTRTGPNAYRLSITPEITPINDSPWYAFKVWAISSRTITLTLVYTDGTHRYRPKISSNSGSTWTTLSSSSVIENATATEATFSMTASSTIRIVAGQPMITVDDQMAWAQGLTRLPFVTQSEIGKSVQNRAIPRLDVVTAPAADSQTLIIMTGQHPPEITGVQAFRSFVDTLLADTTLARKFRRRFNMVIFPLMNPDGWHHGHWRTNANGVDTNRAWVGEGDAAAPEIQHAIRALRAISDPVAFVDFHSTSTNIFYTGADDAEQPSFFVPTWLADITQRVPDWTWTRSINDSADGSSSRSWVGPELGIPSLTWEWSDSPSSDRMLLGPVAGAESLMTLLLKLWQDKPSAAARYDFELPSNLGVDSTGGHQATLIGTPAASEPAAIGNGALSLASPNSYLSIPDFDYASSGSTLSFWFKADASSLTSGSGSVTYLYSHGSPTGTNSINSYFYYYRSSSVLLRIRVRDLNDSSSNDIDLPSSLFFGDGKWHHLGVSITQGTGTSVYFDGVLKDTTTNGKDGINPSGPIYVGIKYDLTSATNYKGLIDDLRIHSSTISSYDLSTIRHRDAPREPYLDWKSIAFQSFPLGESNVLASDMADPDGDGVSNLAEYAFGNDPRIADGQTRMPKMVRDSASGLWALEYARRRLGTGSSGLGWSADSVSYRVWSSENLSTWRSGGSLILDIAPATPLDSAFDWIHSGNVQSLNQKACFYRIEVKRIGN